MSERKRQESAELASSEIVHILQELRAQAASTHTQLRDVFGQLDGVHTELRDLNRRVGKVEISLESLRDEVQAIGQAVDRDAVTLINHGRRITQLEKITSQA